MDKLFNFFFLAALASPLVALVFVARYYFLYRHAPQPRNLIPIAAFVLALLMTALISYGFGVSVGIGVACTSASSSNLCGLFGYLILGPLLSAVSVVLVARAWFRSACNTPEKDAGGAG